MKIILFYYSLFVYMFIEKSRASPPKKGVYQIDEFIKQLMISQKFDELADIIADKAARRIKNLDSPDQKQSLRQRENKYVKQDPLSEEKQNEEYRNDNFEEKTNVYRYIKDDKNSRSGENNNGRENDRESQQKNSFENIGKGRLSSSTFQDRETQHKQKFSKVDMDTFLQTQMTSKELELNFKHLKDELEKHRFNIKQNNLNVKNNYDEEKNNKTIDNIPQVSNRKEITALKNSNSAKRKSQDSKESFNRSDVSSNENMTHESSTFHGSKNKNKDIVINSRENKSGNKIDYVKKPFNRIDIQNPVPRNDQMINYSEDFSITFDENDSTKALFDDDDKVSKELNNRRPEQSSKEIVEVGINRAVNDDNNERYAKSSTKKHVRVENGKQYTFQSSVEYAEYHEALAKENKSFFL